ncbi:MAG: dienelactone hydrolase family protein [Methylococcales bacterium]
MIKTELIEYHHKGTVLEGFFASADTGESQTAVLICHPWAGRNQFVCDKAVELAEMGYAAFAVDMYGKGVLGVSIEENRGLMQPFMDDRALLQRRMIVALETARCLEQVDSQRIVVIGYCFGGLCALDLVRTGVDLQGVVSFHGLLAIPDNTQGFTTKAKVLVLHGHDDPMASSEDVLALQNELTEAGADWQMHIYGNTMHAFTNPEASDPGFGTVYNQRADDQSWKSLQNFLDALIHTV